MDTALLDSTGSRTFAPGVVELVPDRLYLLGGSIKLDGRISWVPPDATGWQPVNAYVLREGDGVLVIDPGIYAHCDIIRRQLESVVPPGSPLSIYLTRAEPDSAGNIGEVASRYPVQMLFAGGGPNPFDAFEAAGQIDRKKRGDRIQMERLPPGYEIPVGGTRGVEVLRPVIRLLATYWAYDRETRTLFTSDSFTHVLQPTLESPRVVDGATPEQVDPAHVRAHILAKFGWLAHAKTQSIVNNLREMRGDRDIERIAPSRGAVIQGRAAVRQHLDAVETVLKELAA